MIGLLPDLPPNVAGFKATGDVTREDYEKVVYPEIRRRQAVDGGRHMSFVFYVDTPLKNFSPGAWIRDIWLGVKGLSMWHKVAIISDVEGIRNFTNTISHLLPGEYRGYPADRLQEAINWAAEEEKKPALKMNTIPTYIEELLPPQTRGESTITSAEISAGRPSDAQSIFERAAERLLDVNQWTDHCGALAAGFQLTDDTGHALEGRAAIGDYIRIDIPGPGPRAGRGYDWVRIEKIERYHIDPTGRNGVPPQANVVHQGETGPAIDPFQAPASAAAVIEESNIALMQVRPCTDPTKKEEGVTAHFLEDSATNTLMIEWNGKAVRATAFGRNEVPNTETPGAEDKIRNGVIGALGAIGLSKIQWKALVQGLLERG